MPFSGWEKTPWYYQRLLRDHHAPRGHKVGEIGSGVLEGASHVTHFHPSPHRNPPARPLHIHPVLARARPRTGKHATSYLMALSKVPPHSRPTSTSLCFLTTDSERAREHTHDQHRPRRAHYVTRKPLKDLKAASGTHLTTTSSTRGQLLKTVLPWPRNRPRMAAEQRRAQMAPSTAAQGLVLCSTLKSRDEVPSEISSQGFCAL